MREKVHTSQRTPAQPSRIPTNPCNFQVKIKPFPPILHSPFSVLYSLSFHSPSFILHSGFSGSVSRLSQNGPEGALGSPHGSQVINCRRNRNFKFVQKQLVFVAFLERRVRWRGPGTSLLDPPPGKGNHQHNSRRNASRMTYSTKFLP